MRKTTNNTNKTEQSVKKTDKNVNTYSKGRKIAIIALICAAVALVFTAICIGAFSGLDDVPNNSNKNQQTSDGNWTNNY